jgi:hypothetical protein
MGSAVNRIVCIYENKILQVVIIALNKRQIVIEALMFDGLMVYGNYYDDRDLLTHIEKKVNEEFINLNMKFDYKHHNNDIVLPADFKILDERRQLMVNNDNDAGKLILKDLKDKIFYYEGKTFLKLENVWTCDIDYIDSFILKHIQNKNILMQTE